MPDFQLRARAQFTPRSDSGQFVKARIVPGITAAVQSSVDRVLDTAKGYVPVRTGDLRDSGQTSVSDTGSTVVGQVEFTAPYASYVEYGTGRRGAASAGAGPYPYKLDWPGMEAQPYLRPAVDQERENIKSDFKNISLSGV